MKLLKALVLMDSAAEAAAEDVEEAVVEEVETLPLLAHIPQQGEVEEQHVMILPKSKM